MTRRPAILLRALLRRRRRAALLVLVLWLSVILGLIAYSALYQSTLDSRLASLRRDSMQAAFLAQAGIARAYADLRNDLIFDFADDDDPPFDAEGDIWANPDVDKLDFELGAGTFSVEIIDQDRLFNINRFTVANLDLLAAIMEIIGYTPEDAQLVAAAIIDYQDADTVPSLPTSEAGDESIAWGLVRAENLGLRARPEDVERVVFPNEHFVTLDQLLDVYGVTPELYFGPGTPEAIHFRELIGPELTDRFVVDPPRRRYLDRDDRALGLRDFLTVWGGSQVNINTAPVHVLEALFKAGGVPDPERTAEAAIRNRRGGRSARIDNSRAYKTIEDIRQDGDIADAVAVSSGFYPVTVRSSTFRIRSVGRAGQAVDTKEVVVRRNMSVMQRLEDTDPIPRSDGFRDRMSDRNDRRTDSDNSQVIRIPAIRVVQWIDP